MKTASSRLEETPLAEFIQLQRSRPGCQHAEPVAAASLARSDLDEQELMGSKHGLPLWQIYSASLLKPADY
jgi:hypothetical protein